jgi:hypothetical protein
MVIWHGNIHTKEDFLEGLWWPKFPRCTLHYGFFLLSVLFLKSNSLRVHFSNLSSPWVKLGLIIFI